MHIWTAQVVPFQDHCCHSSQRLHWCCVKAGCAVQRAAEEARFECARKLTELESRKRYEFLEAMVSSMDAHVRFYERGHEVKITHLYKPQE